MLVLVVARYCDELAFDKTASNRGEAYFSDGVFINISGGGLELILEFVGMLVEV